MQQRIAEDSRAEQIRLSVMFGYCMTRTVTVTVTVTAHDDCLVDCEY